MTDLNATVGADTEPPIVSPYKQHTQELYLVSFLGFFVPPAFRFRFEFGFLALTYETTSDAFYR